ncbi:MAG TPA: ABC transporter permease, partial [Gemmataceae bacterium]
MTRTRLILRNLAYHWRGNLAVLLGVFVGSAVLTGALLVGDSLRGSLRARAERQLGWVDAAMIGGRFVRAELAGALPGHVAPAVMLQGTVRSGSGAAPGDTRLLSKVAILGVDERFWRSGIPEGIDASFWSGGAPRAVLSAPLARSLGVGEGAQVRVGVQKIAAIPRASLLGRRGADESAESVAVTVAAVLPPGHPANDFSLTPNPGTPMNLFLPLRFLQEEIEQPGRVNALFAAGATAEQLQASLKEHATLDDWGLKVVVPEKGPGYFSLESRQLLLEPSVVRTARATARQMGMDSAETLVYLANRIVQGKPPLPDPRKNRKNEVPYSIVAALDPSKPPPLGPFLPEGVKELADDEIVLAAWDESPLKGAEPGAPITLVYFEPEIEGRIEETSETFT